MAMRLNENLDDNGEMHEINVTPFIDVMLVLLIIFMVAAPLATVDVKVNLPASSSQPQPRPEKPIYLSVKADKSMFLGNDPVTEANMINALDSLTAGKKDTTVFFRADKTVDYETMMKVMDTLHQAISRSGWWAKRPSKRSNLPLSTFLLRLALRQLFNR
jgi:biopolymer transport protein ExbD